MIVGIDPSGNFYEGKGTTGIVMVDRDLQIVSSTFVTALDYGTAMEYYEAIINYLEHLHEKYVINTLAIEDYILYADKAAAQINSKLETPRLIGILQYWAHQHEVHCTLRTANQVKKRWTPKILLYKNLITDYGRSYSIDGKQAATLHELDALKHAVHEYHFGKNTKIIKEEQ